jgi:hypothetical protein
MSNTELQTYVKGLHNNLTTKQVYELVKTRFSYNFLPNSKTTNYESINRKVVYNSYNDLVVMNQMCYELCIKNIEIYKNWLETFCEDDHKLLFNSSYNPQAPLGKIDISMFEKVLLPKCNISKLKLTSIVNNGGINDDNNIHRSVGMLINILKRAQSKKIYAEKQAEKQAAEQKTATGITVDNKPPPAKEKVQSELYSKEYCIITSEFCKNIKQVWSMLPKNDVNLKDYNSSIKNITIKRVPLTNRSGGTDNLLIQLVNNLFNIS